MTIRALFGIAIIAMLAAGSAVMGQTGNTPPVALGLIESGTRFESTDVPRAIPDRSGIASTLTVSDFTRPITHVTVDIRIDHTHVGDLILTLVGPDGTTVILSNRRGGLGGQNFGAGTQRTIFDDYAATAIAAGAPPYLGRFRPEQPLSVFNGKIGPLVNGTWTLFVSDNSSYDTGTLLNWSITLATDQPVPSSITTNEDTPVDITLNGYDADSDPITFQVTAPPAHGTLSGTAPCLTYTPEANWFGSDSFLYVVNDGTVDSAAAPVTIEVNSVNDAPVATNPVLTTRHYESTNVPLSIWDFHTTSSPVPINTCFGQITHVTADLRINHTYDGDLGITLNGPDGTGVWLANRNGGVGDNYGAGAQRTVFDDNADTVIWQGAPPYLGTFRPASPLSVFNGKSGAAANGAWTLNVTDNAGGDGGTLLNWSVTLTTNGLYTNEDTPLAINLQASDLENDPLTYRVVTPPAHGTLSGTGPNMLYTPDADYNGGDSFTFVANDGTDDSNECAMFVGMLPVNDAPVATPQTVNVTEDLAKAITLTGTDVDGDSLTFRVASSPLHGTLSGTAPNLTYTPEADWAGTDSFTFVANDGALDSLPGTVSIQMIPVNDAPVAQSQTVKTAEDTTLPIILLASDIDNDPLTYRTVTNPSHGRLVGLMPNIKYIPVANYSGSDSFTFRVFDGHVYSNIALVQISVLPVNDPPQNAAFSVIAVAGVPQVIEVPSHVTDIDGDTLTVIDVSPPAHGQTGLVDAAHITYTPESGYTGADQFTCTVQDPAGATAVVTINATVYAPLAGVTLGFNPVSPQQINIPVTVTATATGGARLQYFFRAGYLLNGAWVWPDSRIMGPANSWTWTPTMPGTYTVVVIVRDTVGGQQISATQLYQVNGTLSAVDFTFSASSPQAANTPITLTASSANGLNVRYRFWVTHKTSTGQWITDEVQPYGVSNTCTWTPGQPGLYTVVVWAREATSRQAYDVYKSRSFTVR